MIRAHRSGADGRSIFARVGGPAGGSSRPPLVFVHGLMVAGGYLRPTLERLVDQYEVAAPDLPGFGASHKPARALTIEELSEALERWVEDEMARPVVLVGCSMGTQVAADLAVRRSDLAAGIVLLGPVMDPAARSVPAALVRWIRELPYERAQIPLMLRDYARGGLRRARRTFEFMLQFPIEDRLARLPMATAVVRGEHDPIVGRRWARIAADLAPHGRYVELPDAAHSANFTAPDAFAAAVHEFATGLGGRDAAARPNMEGVPT